MSKEKNTFTKKERLSSKKEIENLFKSGKSKLVYPILFYYLPNEERTKVLISVSKKNFKKAVERNFIKRKMREEYRLNKFMLKTSYIIGFTFIGKNLSETTKIKKSIVSFLGLI